MKFAVIEVDGSARAVFQVSDGLIDITAALNVTPNDLPAFLGCGAPALAQCKRCVESNTPRLALAGGKLLAPVRHPDKLIGIGMNYRSALHGAASVGMPLPTGKLWFLRPPSCIVASLDPVWLPAGPANLDYEGELAIIIGRRCSHVAPENAAAVIAGYTVANDMTLRDRVPKSLVFAKGFATHTPLGPWLVTPDEVGDSQNLRIRTWVDGELRQDSNTAEMIVSCYELVAELSAAFTLSPGDIILSGTPGGSAAFIKPSPWLRPGSSMRIEIENVGVLENRVVEEPSAPDSGGVPGQR